MKTFNRRPFDIDTSIRNGSKYLNQTEFTGIVQNNNSFDVDQNSFTDALNVYVNDQNTLVSREPLVIDNTYVPYPTKTVDGKTEKYGQLVDIKECNNVRVFVFDIVGEYKIVACRNDEEYTMLSNSVITKYYLTVFNQYIICWNEVNAQVFDTNKSDGWKSLSEFTEPTVVKRVTGTKVEEFEQNQFTNKYQHVYIRTLDAPTQLPKIDDTSNVELKTELIVPNNTIEITKLTFTEDLDYRIVRPIDIPVDRDTQVSIARSGTQTIIAVATLQGVYISLTSGDIFTFVRFPEAASASDIRALSDDGKAFYFLKPDSGVYRYNISEASWSKQIVNNDTANPGFYDEVIGYHFITKDDFCFYTKPNDTTYRIYYYAKGLTLSDKLTYDEYAPGNDITTGNSVTTVPEVVTNTKNNSIKMVYNRRRESYCIILMFGSLISGTNAKQYIRVRSNGWSAGTVSTSMMPRVGLATIDNISCENDIITYSGIHADFGKIGYSRYSVDATIYENNSTFTTHSDITSNVNFKTLSSMTERDVKETFPIYINNSKYIQNGFGQLYDAATLPASDITLPMLESKDKNISADLAFYQYPKIATYGDTYILYTTASTSNSFDYENNWIFTNLLSNDDVVKFIYTYSTDNNYTKIPTVTYSGAELFLGFGNELMITKNIKNGSDTLFNLLSINNQPFANEIKSIINISTTELAIFFENGITICTKVSDDVYGYRYDYTKTRLSLGTKFGDSVINTADGASTLYATPRGLAIMNYQAYMATTDQTLQFVSDKIFDIWNKFYLSSENITLVQHGDYIFVYNTSNKYLMLDLRNVSWWKFEIPYNISKILTDQIELHVIADKLYKFKKIDNGTDKIEDDYIDNKYRDPEDETINWRFMSQRLHFGLPNHYKNMKQIVFHMVQSTGHLSTFATQIKLYRNSVNYKDMEVIPFDFNFYVDEFRTFVKRFNYWKINMLQYGIANDNKTAIPARLVLNGIGVKYEIGDEVR